MYQQLKSYQHIILWGASFLGTLIGEKLQTQGLVIDLYWDKRSAELGLVNGVKVEQPFTCQNKEDTLIIICIGNNTLRTDLAKALAEKGYKHILSDTHLHLLIKSVLINDFDYEGDADFRNMTHVERLEKAIEFAIETDYKIWTRQQNVIEYLRLTENICLYGDENFYDLCKVHCADGNGINNIKYICNGERIVDKGLVPGLSCILTDELAQIQSPVVIISNYNMDISRQLNKMGIEHYFFGDLFLNVFTPHHDKEWFIDQKTRVIAAYDLLEDEQSKEIYVDVLCNRIAPHLAMKTFFEACSPGEYFNTDIFKFSDSETFVDAGAFIGDSIEGFLSAVKNEFEKIFSFELDPANFEVLRKRVSKYQTPKIVLINKGIYNQNKRISLEGTGGGAHISDHFDNIAEVVRLDDFLKEVKPTFIKMDIEGAEIPALQGAEKIISMHNPKLAISAYHRLSDLWEIPLLIKRINSNYKLYLRHHSQLVWDTDCYAMI